jgi:hypothetical protein
MNQLVIASAAVLALAVATGPLPTRCVRKGDVQAYAWLSAALSVGVPEARDGVLFSSEP